MNDVGERNKIKTKPVISLLAIFLGVLVGTTMSYFTSSASFENEFRTGKYKVVTTEEFESPTNWKPGEEIPKTITTTNAGTIDAAVRVSFEEKWFDGDTEITDQVSADSVIINFDNENEWIRQGNYYYYKFPLKAGETTSSFIKSVTLNPNINEVVCTTSADGKTKTCESTNNVVGSIYKLIITKETAQYDAYDKVWTNVPTLTQRENPVYKVRQVDGAITMGDEICIKAECFNVLSSDENNITMLAKYNLNVGNNIQEGTQGIQNSRSIAWNGDSTTQDENYKYPSTVMFSNDPYWGTISEPTDVYNDNASIHTYVDNYKGYLQGLGASIVDARLLKYSESINPIGCDTNGNCPADSFIKNTSFWLGTAFDTNRIYYMYKETGIYRNIHNNDGLFGVRPVIVIPKTSIV